MNNEQHTSEIFAFEASAAIRDLHSFPTRRSSDLGRPADHSDCRAAFMGSVHKSMQIIGPNARRPRSLNRSEEHTSELQSHHDLVCGLLLEKKKGTYNDNLTSGSGAVADNISVSLM